MHCYFLNHWTGGTTFGFLNGANAVKEKFQYQPTVSSYGNNLLLAKENVMNSNLTNV